MECLLITRTPFQISLTLVACCLVSSGALARHGRPLGPFETEGVEYEGRSAQQAQPKPQANAFDLLDPKLAQQLQALILERQGGGSAPSDTSIYLNNPLRNGDTNSSNEVDDGDNPTNNDVEADADNSTSSGVLSINPEVLPEGWTCMDKVMMVEEIEYTDEIQCTHILDESCHETYETVFKTEEVEECKEKFLKNCYIEYHAVPRSEKLEVCQQPMIRDCDAQGDEVCSNEYETVCETTYHENEVEDEIAQCVSDPTEVCNDNGKCTNVPRQVCNVMKMNSTKLTPETDCRQEVREVCGPESCPLTQGPRVCANEIKTFVQDVPEEVCHLNPQRICNPTNKIIPKLEQRVKCIDVPREVCSTVQVEAKKVSRPVVKKWCGILPGNTSGSEEEDDEGEEGTETTQEPEVETTESQTQASNTANNDTDVATDPSI
ncbi:uncharacterized protein LOC131884809 isoform X1 [Tigriopus californicus]|uniref:uncharacterized protein LOC131884809 isoform X1 n=1 Tax=Tigriopus californicus TaxID=6832 RepID=UPI0027DA5179|nr:uncharacterized protein LOC131884809 isoform X1 [Tigriopus californicus]